ncbi:hypothetical protein [Paenibacillus sp. JDR-2]|uniref:hypothetical protein n=1 Tax=Paenibacillus sp. (strain JDR-2) TaxID=324057 RepID=UPI0005A2812F|nr:hypothetical protein [Paenibacillus sp. JDR-2]
MQKGWLLIVMIIFILGITGCGNDLLDGKEIVNVRMECADECKPMKPSSIKEGDMTYEKTDELNVFERAITRAKLIKGELDYGVFFYMHLMLDDGSQRKFVLNITDEDGRTALLVDTDSGKGYAIPENLTEELRAIIW